MNAFSHRLRPLVDAPAAVPGMVVVVLLVAAAASEGGYPAVDWYPAALFTLALLACCVVVLPGRFADVPRPVLIGAAGLFAFALWSYLSIAWADAQGEAWDAANRSLLYALVFCVLALWPQRRETAAVLLGAWVLAVAGISLIEVARVAHSTDPSGFFLGGRLAEPAGYVNAAAASALMPFFAAIVLAGRAEVPWGLRGVFAAGAVVLADVAVLSQSRGAIYSMPILVIVFFAFVGGRLRSIPVLLVVALPVGAAVSRLLDVGDRFAAGEKAAAAVSGVMPPILLGAGFAGVVVTTFAWYEAHGHQPPERVAAARRVSLYAGVGAATVAVVALLVVAGNPFTAASDGWHSFKRGKVVTAVDRGSRFGAGLGSNRYDAYRVALNSFAKHPLQGVGADNFAADYLQHGRSDELLRYPHSLEFRTLSETGLIGTALLVAALAAILAGALRAARGPDPLAAAVAGGAAMATVYWLVHGSFDWFYEFAGLGAAAFAMAGLACSLIPRPEGAQTTTRRLVSGPAAAVAALAGVAAAVSLALPWLAEREVQKAARTWPADPAGAFSRLDRARKLNPLSVRAQIYAGNIALRRGDLAGARGYFAGALRRDGRGSYAALELGAIASQQGDRAAALGALARAHRLAPRDEIIAGALRQARQGRRLNVNAINRQILARAADLVR